jgi:hypothetical protein
MYNIGPASVAMYRALQIGEYRADYSTLLKQIICIEAKRFLSADIDNR